MTNEQTKITALFFDFGGVIQRTFDPRPRRCLDQDLGLPSGGAERAVFGSAHWGDLELGRIQEDEFWRDLAVRLSLSANDLEQFIRRFWEGDRLDLELLNLIRRLRSKGLSTVLLSNGPADRADKLRDLGAADAFDWFVVSGQEGVMKPNPEIYERALARAGVAPEEAVFVDDVVDNVTAASDLGMTGIHFKGLAPLRLQLAELGIAAPATERSAVTGVRAIIFDWAGVLEGSPDASYFSTWEDRLGLRPGELPRLLWGREWREVELGRVLTRDYCEWLAGQLGLSGPAAANAFLEEFYGGDWLHTEVLASARFLRGRYRLALVSNAYAEQDQWLRKQFGVDVYTDFDVYINSAQTGVRKPDPAILELALERLDVQPEEAVFIDDALPNVDAGQALGLHTVHFVEPTHSLRELSCLLGHPIQA